MARIVRFRTTETKDKIEYITEVYKNINVKISLASMTQEKNDLAKK